MKQLHKKFNDCQVKYLLTRYLKKESGKKRYPKSFMSLKELIS